MGGQAIIATLGLGGMCLLMWWLARLAKKRMGIGAGTVSTGALRVVGKRPLDPKSSLFIVEIAGGRHILLGSGADGTVTKIDDITPEEYATMVADEGPAKPRLRVASAVRTSDEDGDDAEEVDADAQQKFASVGESFGHFLGKAREAHSARKDRRASGE